MTYTELLMKTAARKAAAVAELNGALRNPSLGFLAMAEMERNPGMVAWLWLAKGFCEAIAENMDDLLQSADDSDRDDIIRIYMAYEESDPDIYDLLPVEAQLYAD